MKPQRKAASAGTGVSASEDLRWSFTGWMLSVERSVGVTGCGVRCGGSGRRLVDPGRSCEDAESGEASDVLVPVQSTLEPRANNLKAGVW